MEKLGDNVFFRISSTDNILGRHNWWCWQQHKPFELSRKPINNVFETDELGKSGGTGETGESGEPDESERTCESDGAGESGEPGESGESEKSGES